MFCKKQNKNMANRKSKTTEGKTNIKELPVRLAAATPTLGWDQVAEKANRWDVLT